MPVYVYRCIYVYVYTITDIVREMSLLDQFYDRLKWQRCILPAEDHSEMMRMRRSRCLLCHAVGHHCICPHVWCDDTFEFHMLAQEMSAHIDMASSRFIRGV